MTATRVGPLPPKGRPGPKPRGRTVVPLTITVTHSQRALGATLGIPHRRHAAAPQAR